MRRSSWRHNCQELSLRHKVSVMRTDADFAVRHPVYILSLLERPMIMRGGGAVWISFASVNGKISWIQIFLRNFFGIQFWWSIWWGTVRRLKDEPCMYVKCKLIPTILEEKSCCCLCYICTMLKINFPQISGMRMQFFSMYNTHCTYI